jgi:inner membrane protein
MMGRSHLVLAGAAYAALALRPLATPYGTFSAPVLGGLTTDPPGILLASFLIAAACGLAPDIDKAGSTASRSLGLPTRVLSWGIERSFGHRGGFHSLLALILAYIVGDLAGGLAGLTGLGALLAFGWAVHLLTDAWTVHGVPLLWPLSTARLRLPPRLSTGSLLEAVVLVLALILLAVYATWPYLAPYFEAAIQP